jgi:hypothetical protein
MSGTGELHDKQNKSDKCCTFYSYMLTLDLENKGTRQFFWVRSHRMESRLANVLVSIVHNCQEVEAMQCCLDKQNSMHTQWKITQASE